MENKQSFELFVMPRNQVIKRANRRTAESFTDTKLI